MKNFLTAAEAKDKADNSEQAYKILRATIYNNIAQAANQGCYKVVVNGPATYLLASRLREELKNNGYSVSDEGLSDGTYAFHISWLYA